MNVHRKAECVSFNQFGVEVLGAKDPLLDVEAIALGWSFVSALGLSDLKVLINTLGDDESRDAYRAALREHFKNDISSMCTDCQRRYEQNPLRILDCKIDHDLPIMQSAPKMSDYLNEASKTYFSAVLEGLDALGIPYEIDDRLVRGLDYYTHTVFEVVSVNKEMGAQSTVFAGGRYDGLVEYFGGPKGMSGIGWAMGLERLLLACEAEGIQLEEQQGLDAYILCLAPQAKIAALQMVTELRSNGYRCDMDYLGRSFKAQFKSIERKHAKYAIFLGDKELETKQITIKEIATQQQHTVPLDDVVAVMDRLFGEIEADEDGCACGHHHE